MDDDVKDVAVEEDVREATEVDVVDEYPGSELSGHPDTWWLSGTESKTKKHYKLSFSFKSLSQWDAQFFQKYMADDSNWFFQLKPVIFR